MKKPSRKFRVGTNVVVSVVLALGCWVMVGWLNVRHYHRFDLTANRAYSLSQKSIAILRDLDRPLAITTLFRPGTLLERNVKDLLAEYASYSRQITVSCIDPDRDAAKVELLSKRLKLDSFQINSVLFEMDGKTKQVTSGEMEEAERGANPFAPSKTPPKFKGEEAFTCAILNLTATKAPLVFFTSGHGERDFEGYDRAGVSELVKFLKRENYVVKKLAMLQQGDIPSEADVVVIAAPKQRFLPAEVDKIDAYLQRGGKLLILLDPLAETGLEPLLQSWGVEVGNDVVIDPVHRLFFAGPTTLVASDFGFHPITQKLRGSSVILSLTRSVRLAKDATGDAQILLETSKEAWGETDLENKQAQYEEGKDLKGPVSLAVAVSKSTAARSIEKESLPQKKQKGPSLQEDKKTSIPQDTRLVVIGDSDFLTNLQVSNARNLDLFTNVMNWLAHREKLISIGPKASDIRQVTLNAGQMQMIFWFTVLGMPLAGVVSGIVVRYRRRR